MMRLRVFILMGLTILLVGLSYVVLRALNMQMVNIAPAKLINIVHSNTADDETNVEAVPSASPISPSKSPTEQQGRNDNEHQVDQPVDDVSKSEVKGDVIVNPVPDVSKSPQLHKPIEEPPLPSADSSAEEIAKILSLQEQSQPKVELPIESPSDIDSKMKNPPPPKPVRDSSLNVNIDAPAKPIEGLSPVVENVQSQPKVELPIESPSDIDSKMKNPPPPKPVRDSSLNVNIDAPAKPIEGLSPVVENVQSQSEIELPKESPSDVDSKPENQPPPKPQKRIKKQPPPSPNADAAKPAKIAGIKKSNIEDAIINELNAKLNREAKEDVDSK